MLTVNFRLVLALKIKPSFRTIEQILKQSSERVWYSLAHMRDVEAVPCWWFRDIPTVIHLAPRFSK
jgi:hypothetical protein